MVGNITIVTLNFLFDGLLKIEVLLARPQDAEIRTSKSRVGEPQDFIRLSAFFAP
jgi:hypothetical protein